MGMDQVRLQAGQFQERRYGESRRGECLRSDGWQAINRNAINHLPVKQSLLVSGKNTNLISVVAQTRSQLLQLAFCAAPVRQIALNDHCDARQESSQQEGYGLMSPYP